MKNYDSLPISYQELKDLVLSKGIPLQASVVQGNWELIAVIGGVLRSCAIYPTDANYQDFEQNVKPLINTNYELVVHDQSVVDEAAAIKNLVSGTNLSAANAAISSTTMATQKAVAVRPLNRYEGWNASTTVSRFELSTTTQQTFNIRPIISADTFVPPAVETVATLSYGATNRVAQIFKAKTNNIKELLFQLQATTSLITLDDFSYASDTAARAAWVTTDTTNTVVYIGTTTLAGSMRIHTTAGKSLGDLVTRTFTSTQDLSGMSDIAFRFRQSQSITGAKLKFRVIDSSGYKASCSIIVNNTNTWNNITISKDGLIPEGTPPNYGLIKKMEFEVAIDSNACDFYIDDLQWGADAGGFEVRLYDLGTNPTPTSLPANPVTLDSGYNYVLFNSIPVVSTVTEVPVQVGIDVGVSTLTIDNYYAVVFSNVNTPTTVVYFMGLNSGTYTRGGAYTSTNSGATLTPVNNGNADLYFITACVPAKAVITGIRFKTDGDSKGSTLYASIIHTIQNLSHGFLIYNAQGFDASNKLEFDFLNWPATLNSDHHLAVYWIPDPLSTAGYAIIELDFLYEPISIH